MKFDAPILSLYMKSSVIQDRLQPGERILWSGKPFAGLMLTGKDAFLVPFSIMFAAFAVFWLVGVTEGNAPTFFYFWGAMFVCIGLFFVFGRFLLDAWLRRRTSYAVTDSRILIARRAPLPRFTSLQLSNLPAVELSGDPKSRGSLRFAPSSSPFGTGGSFGFWVTSLDSAPQFLGIEDAGKVYDLVMQAAKSLKR